uniref:Putative secreted protein n=1 Tax=Anopheles marajoara TaxID=58244 RepID=A0A2M4C6X8_9DIPT
MGSHSTASIAALNMVSAAAAAAAATAKTEPNLEIINKFREYPAPRTAAAAAAAAAVAINVVGEGSLPECVCVCVCVCVCKSLGSLLMHTSTRYGAKQHRRTSSAVLKMAQRGKERERGRGYCYYFYYCYSADRIPRPGICNNTPGKHVLTNTRRTFWDALPKAATRALRSSTLLML